MCLMKKTFQRKGVKRVDFSYNSGDRKLNNRAFLVAAKDGLIALFLYAPTLDVW